MKRIEEPFSLDEYVNPFSLYSDYETYIEVEDRLKKVFMQALNEIKSEQNPGERLNLNAAVRKASAYFSTHAPRFPDVGQHDTVARESVQFLLAKALSSPDFGAMETETPETNTNLDDDEAFKVFWKGVGQTIGEVAARLAWNAALARRDAQIASALTKKQESEQVKAIKSSDVIAMASLFESGKLTPNNLDGWKSVVEVYEEPMRPTPNIAAQPTRPALKSPKP